MIRTRRYSDVTLGVNNRGNNAVQIGTQVWTAKNLNVSIIGSLVIPEVQNNTNTEQLTNPTITGNATAYTLGTGSAYGTDNIIVTNGSAMTYQTKTIIPNRWYKMVIVISAYTSGSLKQYIGGTEGAVINSAATFTEYLKAGSTNQLIGFNPTGFSGTIDSISCELIGWMSLNTIPNAADRLAWCNYNNLQSNGDIYGKLYNWWAANEIKNELVAMNSDWKLPSPTTDYVTLKDYLGFAAVAGGKMKEAGLAHWNTPNTGADNSSGFGALGSGFRRDDNGGFISLLNQGPYWTSIENYSVGMLYNSANLSTISSGEPSLRGYSIRLVKK